MNKLFKIFLHSFQIESEGILHDVVCVASRKLFSQQAQLYDIVRELGGDTKALYDNTCTHFIHQVC